MSAPNNSHLQLLQYQFAQALLDIQKSSLVLENLSTDIGLREDRLAFYRGNLSAIWQQTLRNAYPVIWRLVGEDYFADLAREYGRLFPSQSGDLNQFGTRFSEYLRSASCVGSYPYFADVAALEWQVHSAYYAEDAPALSLENFLSQSAERAQECALIFHPAAQLHSANYDSVAIWQAHQFPEVQSLQTPIQKASYGLIVRPNWQGQVIRITKASFSALEVLQKGGSLGQSLETALEVDAGFDVASSLQMWFANSCFSGFVCKE